MGLNRDQTHPPPSLPLEGGGTWWFVHRCIRSKVSAHAPRGRGETSAQTPLTLSLSRKGRRTSPVSGFHDRRRRIFHNDLLPSKDLQGAAAYLVSTGRGRPRHVNSRTRVRGSSNTVRRPHDELHHDQGRHAD